MTERRNHWEGIYQSKKFEACSWYQEIPTHSLEMIDPLPLAKTDSILDVGGGESYLADSLLKKGFSTISVLDIAPTALEKSKKRMGKQAEQIKWIHQDITQFVPKHAFHLWHDRAVFHFLRTTEDISAYGNVMASSVVSGGYAVVGTFSKKGPLRCSGIDIQQYSLEELAQCFETNFEVLAAKEFLHPTPAGSKQAYSFCTLKRK